MNVNANDVKEVFYINNISGKDQALVPVTLNDTSSVTFQIDTGLSANILLKVEHNGSKHELYFVIVVQRVTPLLGLKSCQGMSLFKIMVPGVHTSI